MTIGTIEIGNAEDNELAVTLRGRPEDVVKVLVGGLPREALVQIKDAMDAELVKRRDGA